MHCDKPVAASIVVRSYHRRVALLELVQRLRRQEGSAFEIVIVEQSDDPRLVEELNDLADDRIRIFVRNPLGAAGARNEGARQARGNILVFIDDDDLPVGNTWLQKHLRNYGDPSCMGVTGRLTSNDRWTDPTPRFPRLLQWASMRHTPFKDAWTYPIGSLRTEADFCVGNNFSVRSSLVRRIGGWDEGVPMHEEHSFAFKFHKTRSNEEYFVYDPNCLVYRRMDIEGGLNRRTREDWYESELAGRTIYYHHVVGHYFPRRFRVFYPLFLMRLTEQTLVWIWDPDTEGRSLSDRLRASIGTLYSLPRVVTHYRRPEIAKIQRVPSL